MDYATERLVKFWKTVDNGVLREAAWWENELAKSRMLFGEGPTREMLALAVDRGKTSTSSARQWFEWLLDRQFQEMNERG